MTQLRSHEAGFPRKFNASKLGAHWSKGNGAVMGIGSSIGALAEAMLGPDFFEGTAEEEDSNSSARIAAQRAENLPKYEARVDAIRALSFGDRRRACRDQATTIFDLPEVVDVGEVRRAA